MLDDVMGHARLKPKVDQTQEDQDTVIILLLVVATFGDTNGQ